MLDRLPIELVSHILSFLDPPSPSRLTKPSSLYACCLVSKRVKEVAQPLLWLAVVVEKRGDLKAVKPEATSTGLIRYTRILAVDKNVCAAKELEGLAQNSTGLREIRLRNLVLTNRDGVDAVLPHLTHLRRISFFNLEFLEVREPLAFPSLFSLSLHAVYTTRALLEGFLVPQYLPHLRMLSLTDLWDHWMSGTCPFLPALSAALLDQLDVLQLAHEELHLSSAVMASHPHTLLSAHVEDLPNNPPRSASLRYKHLRIRPFPLDDSVPMDSSERAGLDELAESLPHLNLTTLLLPLQLQHPSFRNEHVSILAECEKKRIDVLWEDALEEEDADILIAEKFRDWRLKKEKEEAERAG
ncbi:hypothetical protein JCM6882_006642 [Rhodosporidiobolus microsporus]